ncbi:hypothetical protein [Haloplanus sp. C73]|jgi:hypothetical protein|uniref:hypothetical protein n=1 Tax=Haloplanus sp. C73 TaxID=3421641 RepID=UPI003EBE9BBE
MPSKSGISHTFAALVALAAAPLLKQLISLFVNARDMEAAIESAGTVLAEYPHNPLAVDATTTTLYLLAVALLTFVWGYAYHVSRH